MDMYNHNGVICVYIYNVDECDNPNEQPSSNGILRCQHFIYIHHPSSIIHHPSSSSSSPSSPPPSSSAAATSFGYIHYYKEICIMYYIYIIPHYIMIASTIST